MKTSNFGMTVAGMLLLLLSPMLGTYLAGFYLRLTEGMETEMFLCIVEGCIRSIQLIGALVTAYGFFHRKGEAKAI